MAGEGGFKPEDAMDATVPASATPASRSSLPEIAPPPDERYRLGTELGRGGMGRVVEAYDTHLRRTVALKEVLHKGDASNIERRFQREVRITARLEHASIVPVYDSGLLGDGRPFYVMRRVSGKPLDQVIAVARTLEARLALLPNVLAAIDAMAHAHRRGVIHRDLKPQNILVGELGETVVIDWGLAKVIGEDDEPVSDSLEPRVPTAADSLRTQVGAVFGTPGFMAPEQARGDELGPPGDVYALGATLYQLVVGRPPVVGRSATEVITSTLNNLIQPIGEACPDAPAELVTITEKALAFDPVARYRNAGELAEDVRRFLTGQLVAAHHYTTRQRLARFARRHRAALAIAALAAVGLAIVIVVSVRRIVRERDVATQMSAEAQRQRATAQERELVIRERADELLLLHARNLLDEDPTHALAVLKQLELTDAVRDDALAVARAAVSRGVAWGLPTLPNITVSLEMTNDGKRLLQMNRDGVLQILDLDARRVVAKQTFPNGGNAHWIAAGTRVLVRGYKAAPSMLDPATGRIETLASAPLDNVSVTADGSRIAGIDTEHRLVTIDVATRAVSVISGYTPVRELLVAPDGTWIAFDERIDAKRTRLVVIDPAGKLLLQREGYLQLLAGSSSGKLGMYFDDGVFEAAPLRGPQLTAIASKQVDSRSVRQLWYRDERLQVVAARAIYAAIDGALVRTYDPPEGAVLAVPVHGATLAVTSSDGRIRLVQDALSHTLTVPHRPHGFLRVAGAPGTSRLVATSFDALLLWDLATVLPRRVPDLAGPVFATDNVLVTSGNLSTSWTWLDLATGETRTRETTGSLGMPIDFAVAYENGRAAVTVESGPKSGRADIAMLDGTLGRIEPVVPSLFALVQGDAYVFSRGGNTVYGQIGIAGAPRELVKVDGEVSSVAALGTHGFAALGTTGELVRGHFDGHGLQRVRFPDVTPKTYITPERARSVLIIDGARMWRWETAIEPVFTATAAIVSVHSDANGTIVALATGELMHIPASGDRTPRRLPTGPNAVVTASGTRVVSRSARDELEILELPALVTWSLPRMYTSSPKFSVSPGGHRIYQSIGRDAVVWQLPQVGSDIPAWLDAQTNAVEVQRHVQWPWQTTP